MIEGTHVGMRPVETEDLEFLYELTNDSRLAAMVVGWDFPVSLRGQANWLDKVEQEDDTVRFVITELSGGTAVGLTGLWDIDWHNRSALGAVKLAASHQGRGLGSDVVMAMAAYAFDVVGLRRLHSQILDYNEASLSVYVDKCGWRIEGRESQSVYRKGRWCDLLRVAILRDEFRGLDRAQEYSDRVCPVNVVVMEG